MNQKGQAFLESIFALPIAIFGFLGFLTLIMGLLTSVLAHHRLYEALICEQLFPKPTDCLEEARSSLKKILFFAQVRSLNEESQEHLSSLSAEVKLPLGMLLNIQESLKLPLK